jgi:hypothetical protein
VAFRNFVEAAVKLARDVVGFGKLFSNDRVAALRSILSCCSIELPRNLLLGDCDKERLRREQLMSSEIPTEIKI